MKNFFNFLRKKGDIVFILLIFFLGFFLRIYRLHEFISFHQDQVRDLLYIKDHFEKKQMILLGPKASVGDFYLPPFWYYLMSFAYLFSPSPLSPAVLVALINSLTVFLFYFLGKSFFDKKVALVSSFIFAISPFSIEYSRFAWNPNPIILFSFLTFYFLLSYLKKESLNDFILGTVAANLSLQLHYQGFIIFSFYFLTILFFKKINLKKFIIYLVINLLLILPFIIFEIKNHFPNILGIINFIINNQTKNNLKLFGIPFFVKFILFDFSSFISRTLFFKNLILGYLGLAIIFFLMIKNFFSKKQETKILNYFFIFSFFMFFIYKNSLIDFYLLFLVPFLILYFVIFLKDFLKNNFLFTTVVFILIFLNLVNSPVFGRFDNTYLWLERSVKTVTKEKNFCVFYDIFPQTFIEDKLRYFFSIEKNKEENNCQKILNSKNPKEFKNIKNIFYFCEPAICFRKNLNFQNKKEIRFPDLEYGVKIYRYKN